MPRPRRCRWVYYQPTVNYFKPRGVPIVYLEEVRLAVEECEAIRLADLEGMYQEKAAKKLKVSRQTFGRILENAHRKIAEAIVKGKALRIEGGDYLMARRIFHCRDCDHAWEVSYGTERPGECPKCKSSNIHRAEYGRGYTRRAGRGRGPGRSGGQRGPTR